MLFVICDDEERVCTYIQSKILEKYSYCIETACFTSTAEMIEFIKNGRIPDAIIMDICVGEENGILQLSKIKNIVQDTPVIFITGYMEYCQDIFIDFKPWGLLTKLISEERLFYHVDNIINKFNRQSMTTAVTFNRKTQHINNNDIIYIESTGRKLIYHLTENKNTWEYIKLDEALAKLRYGFLKCHKSYAVNVKYVAEQRSNAIILDGGFKVPVSRKYSSAFKQNYLKYVTEQLGL